MKLKEITLNAQIRTLKNKIITRINIRKTGIPNAPNPRLNETIIPIAVYDEGIVWHT